MLNELMRGSIPAWVYIPVVFFVWIFFLKILKGFIFRYIRRLAAATKTKLDDLFVRSADLPLTIFIYTSGAAVAERLLPMATGGKMTEYFLVIFKAAGIVAVVLFVDRFIYGLLKIYAQKVDVLKSSGAVARGVARFIVIGLGVLVLLDSFGISVTPLIASLGIGSLAVALALQPTLENFFSGIQVITDKAILEGHFIRLESGEEGYVERIGWRTTWLRMLPNNMIIVPNKVLVNSRLVNYYYPSRDLAVLVEVGVHYGSDLEVVEKATIDVAKEVMRVVAGGVPTFEPFIRYHTFGDYSVDFSVVMRAREFVDQYLIKHEFIKRLHKRYAKEGIVIPFPTQAVNLEQEEFFSKNSR